MCNFVATVAHDTPAHAGCREDTIRTAQPGTRRAGEGLLHVTG